MKGSLKFSSAVIALCLAAPGYAQDVSTEDRAYSGAQIGEIVVTAQKRSENVQSVPIAITAIGGDALAERGVGSVSNLAAMTPSVSLDAGTAISGGSTAVLTAFIRGIGQNEFAITTDPGVGIYLDGVYLARTVGANMDLPDVDRVEVLKGPQGTLFGRNAVGGAINVVTRTPSDQFGIRGSITVGRFNRIDADASVDLPISENLTSLWTVSVLNRDGYAKRKVYDSPTPYVTEPFGFKETAFSSGGKDGSVGQQSLRGKLLWRPTDGLKVTLAGDFTRVRQTALPTAILQVYDVAGVFAGLAENNIPGTALDPSGTSGFNLAGLYNFCIGATAAQIAARNAQNLCGARGTPLDAAAMLPPLASVNVDGDPFNDRLPWDGRWITTDPDETYSTGNSFSWMRSYGLSATIDYDLSDTLAVRSITGYRSLWFNFGADLDNSPLQFQETSAEIDQWQFSQELQLIGHGFDDRLKYVLGGYYFYERADEQDYAPLNQGLLWIDSPYFSRTKNYAFFGQMDYRLSDLIGLTVGGRYTHERKSFLSGQTDLNGLNYKLFNCTIYGPPCQDALGFVNPGDPLQIYIDEWQYGTFKNFSPKLGIQLHPARDVMAYGTWSRGYKSGGWTTRLSNPLPYAPSYDPEKAETFELGVKSRLFDNRLQLNVAAFTTNYKGIQLPFQQGPDVVQQNAGNARIKGVEVEFVTRPLPALTLTGSVGYLDARYTSVLPGAVIAPGADKAGLFVGSPLAKVPEWKFNISPRYEVDLGSGGAIVLLADYTHTSSMWNDTERTYLLKRQALDMINASISYRDPSDRYTVTLGGTNITGKRYIQNGTNQIAIGLVYGNYNRPGDWYLKFGFKF